MERLREALRDAREGTALRVGAKIGRPMLSKLTARDGRGAIHSQTIKNIEDGRIADPGVVTLARLIEAMGLDLTTFFAHVEGLTEPTRQSELTTLAAEVARFLSLDAKARSVLLRSVALAEGDELSAPHHVSTPARLAKARST